MTPRIVRTSTVWLGPHIAATVRLLADGTRHVSIGPPVAPAVVVTLTLPDAQARNLAFALLAEPEPQPEPETP